MSVKISRREETRDTSLQNFLLSAILPLLVTGLIGYFVGQAGAVDARVNSGDVVQMEQRARAAERKLAEREWFVSEVDSLFHELVVARDERRREFVEITRQGGQEFDFGGDPLANWSRDMREDYDRLSRAISELDGSLAGRGVLTQEAVHPVIQLYKELNQQNRTYFSDQRACYSSQNMDQRQLTETFADQERDLQTELDDMEAQLKIAQRKLENRDLTIADLRQQAPTGGGGGGQGAGTNTVSYRAEATAINSAVFQIESISKRIPSGVLVSKKKKQEIEEEITRQLSLIKNAVAVIE